MRIFNLILLLYLTGCLVTFPPPSDISEDHCDGPLEPAEICDKGE